ncbi:hypothetical protein ANO14919_142710 [Xylariales sp. No.14919]|nr:hypothetical protein ANO14919_142710 [Xylariales sp. No.14919]
MLKIVSRLIEVPVAKSSSYSTMIEIAARPRHSANSIVARQLTIAKKFITSEFTAPHLRDRKCGPSPLDFAWS